MKKSRSSARGGAEPFRRYLTVDEERALFRAVNAVNDDLARRDSAWMRLARHTGIRVGALAKLNVHEAKQALQWKEIRLPAEIMKRRKAHAVHLNKEAARALSDLLSVRARMAKDKNSNPNAPLVVTRRGARISVRSLQARFSEWCAAAGLPVDASPHWLRHTLAKRIMARSTAADPAGIVRRVLGHASAASTAIYTQPDRDDIAAALDEAAN